MGFPQSTLQNPKSKTHRRAALLAFCLAPFLAFPLPAAPASLAEAAEHRDATAFNRLIAAKPIDVNAAQPDGMTALLWAAYHDNLDQCRALLQAGAMARAANRYGITPLALACQNGNAELVAALLAAGVDPNLAGPGGETPLHTAARTGQPGPVRALLAAGAKPNVALPNGQTPLMWAASEGHTKVVELLLAGGADLNTKLASGFNAWLFAVRAGRMETVRALLKAGADLNYATPPGEKPKGKQPVPGTSALILAIENGHFELAAELVDRGADPNDLRSGYGPLHVLTWVRKPDISEGNGDPPPDGSGRLSSADLVRHLVAKGAKVDLPLPGGPSGPCLFARKGCTPLLLAADRADAAYVKLLVELGADPKAQNVEGGTALMTAAGLGAGPDQDEAGTEDEALETVAYLLSLGADPNQVTTQGETAMHGAAYAKFPRMIKFLEAHGAKIEIWNQANKQGWSPLRIAEGHRSGNFKPDFDCIAALKELMTAHGVAIPGPMERAKPLGYQP
ncbi:MAG TPA: ankyrin repeat domain-containing protein [Lacunisphaera sp.]|nr:ankyrin repeat domain-containing protein [Lacunisphaera sp.]